MSVAEGVIGDINSNQPVAPAERILALDVLRGFALFGVLLAYALWNLGSPPESQYSRFDLVAEKALSALVDHKFYTILAFLFGLGFSLQLKRANEKGLSVVSTYCRRLFALILIGLLHALLLRNGDILVPYAVCGFLLIPFRKASNRIILIAAFLMIFSPFVVEELWRLTGAPLPERPNTDGMSYLAANFEWVKFWYSTAIIYWCGNISLFLLGFYAGREGVFQKIAADRKRLLLIMPLGLLAGVTFYFLRYFVDESGAAQEPYNWGQKLAVGLFYKFHAWGLAAFYASILLLLSQKMQQHRWLAPLAAVGRMALTNYLLQALIIIPVCIIFNLFDKVTPTVGLLLALAVWAVQVPFSLLWLKYFNFGPFEWIWRSLTYGKIQHLRKTPEKEMITA